MTDLSWLSFALAVLGGLVGAVVGAFGAGWRIKSELRALERDLIEKMDKRSELVDAKLREDRILSDRLYSKSDSTAVLMAELRASQLRMADMRVEIERLSGALDSLSRKIDRCQINHRVDRDVDTPIPIHPHPKGTR